MHLPEAGEKKSEEKVQGNNTTWTEIDPIFITVCHAMFFYYVVPAVPIPRDYC